MEVESDRREGNGDPFSTYEHARESIDHRVTFHTSGVIPAHWRSEVPSSRTAPRTQSGGGWLGADAAGAKWACVFGRGALCRDKTLDARLEASTPKDEAFAPCSIVSVSLTSRP